jgi:hypothetical protein
VFVNDIWVPIAIALFGNAVVVAIVLISNRQATKTERSRQDREDVRLEKSRQDIRAAHAMEQQRLLRDMQKGIYLEFHQLLRQTALVVHNASYDFESGNEYEIGLDWNQAAFESLNR